MVRLGPQTVSIAPIELSLICGWWFMQFPFPLSGKWFIELLTIIYRSYGRNSIVDKIIKLTVTEYMLIYKIHRIWVKYIYFEYSDKSNNENKPFSWDVLKINANIGSGLGNKWKVNIRQFEQVTHSTFRISTITTRHIHVQRPLASRFICQVHANGKCSLLFQLCNLPITLLQIERKQSKPESNWLRTPYHPIPPTSRYYILQQLHDDVTPKLSDEVNV